MLHSLSLTYVLVCNLMHIRFSVFIRSDKAASINMSTEANIPLPLEGCCIFCQGRSLIQKSARIAVLFLFFPAAKAAFDSGCLFPNLFNNYINNFELNNA